MAKRAVRTRAGDTSAKSELMEPTEQASDTQSNSMGSEPSEEDIRVRAYHRYLDRGGEPGGDFDDWMYAERELKGRR